MSAFPADESFAPQNPSPGAPSPGNPGLLHDRYQCQQQLGRKAGRQTWLAQDLHTQEWVVVKLLSFNSDFSWEDLKLFEREAETLRSLTHPAIPRYLDSFELETPTHKGFALVQSYIDAPSLEEYLKTGRSFSEVEVKQIVQAVLEILQVLHDRQPPVIHRDIKPSNLLLGDRSGNHPGQVYLVDFGSVQTLATREGKTVTVVGTYGYMPPEQFGGIAAPASDLYSLGATAIALLTRTHPADLPQANLQLQFESIAPVSDSFAAWLKQMTAPALDRRFSSARSALNALYFPSSLASSESAPVIRWRQQATSGHRLLLSALKHSVLSGLAAGSLGLLVTQMVLGTLNSDGGSFLLFLLRDLGSSLVMGLLMLTLGGIWGGLVGLMNGAVVGMLTRLWFFPLSRRRSHQTAVTIASLCVSAVLVFSAYQSTRIPYWDSRWIVLPPLIITTLVTPLINHRLLHRWYRRQPELPT